MKNIVALPLLSLLIALPAWAGKPAPRLEAATRAQTVSIEQKYLEQSVAMNGRSSFSVDDAAHAAKLTGRGSAQLDNGLNSVGAEAGGTAIDITFANTEDAGFKACRAALEAKPAARTILISGHGYFTLSLNGSAVAAVTMTLSDVISCTVD